MKRLYKGLSAVSALLFAAILQAEVTVPVSRDLQQDGREAARRQLPLMLVFSAIDCPFCRELEQDFLQPMLLGGEYDGRVMIRRLLLDNGSHVVDFEGRKLPAVDLANGLRAFVTPTILFLDGNGRELTERIKGINTPELFGAYLDACIEVAQQQLVDPSRPLSRSGCRALPLTTAAP